MTSVTITYETLYELLRREKNREELQDLDNEFLINVVNYLKDKNKIMQSPGGGMFGAEEQRKTQNQLINVKTMLTELYNRREKKIINAALDESKVGTGLINKDLMLIQEKVMYEQLVSLLKRERKNILLSTLAMKVEAIKPEIKEIEEPEQPKDLKTTSDSSSLKKLKFKQDVPKFMGTDLQVYGPFKPGEEAALPEDVARVIITKGKAEEI